MDNDELKIIWKEAIVSLSRYCPSIGMGSLRKTKSSLIQNSQHTSQDLQSFTSFVSTMLRVIYTGITLSFTFTKSGNKHIIELFQTKLYKNRHA
jgi:hypothetical protein